MVESADSDQEEHNLDIVEDVDPLLPFGSLSTNIEHLVREVSSLENGLADARRAETCAEDILVIW